MLVQDAQLVRGAANAAGGALHLGDGVAHLASVLAQLLQLRVQRLLFLGGVTHVHILEVHGQGTVGGMLRKECKQAPPPCTPASNSRKLKTEKRRQQDLGEGVCAEAPGQTQHVAGAEQLKLVKVAVGQLHHDLHVAVHGLRRMGGGGGVDNKGRHPKRGG